MFDHPEYAALLRDVLVSPDIDSTRLILADWLEDKGGQAGTFWAATIREMIEKPHLTVEKSEGSLLFADPKAPGTALVSSLLDLGALRCQFRRGFIESVTLPIDAFNRHAAVIFAAHPITSVTITDRCPVWRTLFWTWVKEMPDVQGECYLPEAIYNMLPLVSSYVSVDSAMYALSATCVACGRLRAGLP